MKNLLKGIIKKLLPAQYFNSLRDYLFIKKLEKKGFVVRKSEYFYEVMDNTNRVVRMSRKHRVYIHDILNYFDHYFCSVVPLEIDGLLLADFSTPRIHEVVGFTLHPIMFSSFPEAIEMTQQYLDFAKLENGSIVLDLGAYSGLTSIMFDQLVSNNGRVISIDADKLNIKCIKKNFELYNKITGRRIELLEGAVWKDNNGITFSTEGNMGSSAVEYVGDFRGEALKVKTFTLSTIVKTFNLQKVDFIKCDIEGAESVIFNDLEFFSLFRPRIIVEPHNVEKENTLHACTAQLAKYGYTFKQHRGPWSLIECYPAADSDF